MAPLTAPCTAPSTRAGTGLKSSFRRSRRPATVRLPALPDRPPGSGRLLPCPPGFPSRTGAAARGLRPRSRLAALVRTGRGCIRSGAAPWPLSSDPAKPGMLPSAACAGYGMPSRITRSAAAVMIMPFRQNPHCAACAAMNAACTGCGAARVPSPSSVVTARPCTIPAGRCTSAPPPRPPAPCRHRTRPGRSRILARSAPGRCAAHAAAASRAAAPANGPGR